MVNFSQKDLPANSFHKAYLNLCEKDRIRIRDLIIIYSDISTDTFYRWLKDFTPISKNDRWVIAKLFDIPVKDLFTQN